ncbi:hypothetical protein BHG07_00125 [Brenneria salicis ATCC 15712 = DSM 30166]|nr:hypothetical protein BHG07_00125 [Brenneria salicis ATCC 15712 = DSM 30166]
MIEPSRISSLYEGVPSVSPPRRAASELFIFRAVSAPIQCSGLMIYHLIFIGKFIIDNALNRFL